MFLLPIVFLLLIQSHFLRAESFTSTTHLTQLFKTEITLAKSLEAHLKKEYDRLDQIEKYLYLIKDEIRQAQSNEEYYFGNPVNSHLFIKHLTADWYKIEEILPQDFLQTLGDHWLFPSFEDYTGSAIGLMRLQDTYKLNSSRLANGEISTKFKSRPLNALECFDLGRVAYTNGDFYHTLMWMQEALDHLKTEKSPISINKIEILDHLAYATSQQGNIEHALAITKEMLTIAPNHIRANNNKVYYETLLKNRTSTKHPRKGETGILLSNNEPNEIYQIKNQRPDEYLEEQEVYEKLCRQNGTELSSKRQSKLFCRYRHNHHPYLILRPIKEEQLLDHPVIYLFHDVVRHSDVEHIKSLAAPKLQRAVVRDFVTDTFKPADYRISKSAWLRDDDSPVVARLSKLIEAATNLTMKTAEDLQIANYGVGGHYEPHFDFARKSEKEAFQGLGAGNRIATWLTYLSDVEQGGATVFPVAGGHLKPRKGSAVFWYNLYASGEGDYTTRHAACPVLIGNKWVANKWIHERGQEFRRPCSLNPMS